MQRIRQATIREPNRPSHQPIARPEILDAFWKFAAERQEIFYRRLRGEPRPWTRDPVLAEFKFCNVFRASDRVSQFLIREVIYGDRLLSPEDTLLRIVLFRLFSRCDTWLDLEHAVGEISAKSFDQASYATALDEIRPRHPIYTAAFILSASAPFGYASKHRNHLALVDTMISDGLTRLIAKAKHMAEVFELLVSYPMIGPFMGYQLAVDINYSELTDFSEDEFTVAGPGALRGIAKVFSDTGGRSAAAVISQMVREQEEAFESRGLRFEGLFGRRLHAIDVQNLFCEVDKYCRVTFPELRSDRTRIKQRFCPTNEPLRQFYPPKWGIDLDSRPLDRPTTDSVRATE